MIKKRKERLIRYSAILQIILLISFSFAFSFIFNAGIVSVEAKSPQIAVRTQRGLGLVDNQNLPGESIILDNQNGVVGAVAPNGEIYKYIPPGEAGGGVWNSVGEGINSVIAKDPQNWIQQGTTGGIQEVDKLYYYKNADKYIGLDASGKPVGAYNLGVDGKFTKITGGAAGVGKEYCALGFFCTGLAEGTAGAHLVQGLVWAAIAYGAGKMVGSLIGLNDKNSNALGISLAAGVFTYKGILALQKSSFGIGQKGILSGTGFLGKTPLLPAIGVAVAVFILLYKKESKKLVTFQCLPWEPPIGGSSCEQCNKDPLRPCSEYRCKALGQACEIVNAGTQEERCTWVNPGDVNSPTITPWTDALRPINLLKYIPDNTIRPPNRGVKIVDSGNSNGCLEPFTPLEFGINLNEPSQCKIDYDRNNTFVNMQYYFGESNLYRYNHTQKMRLPAPNSGLLGAESPLLQNNNIMNLFVRCQDANGNVNEDAFVFTFCVDPSPDTTPPIIEGTSIIQNGAVQFNVDKVPIEVYTNEPAVCKWSRNDKAYDDMENTMSCANTADAVNADLQYTCSGDLTGIANQQNNDFYFKCRDNQGNTNVQSHKLTLRGSQELNIISISPANETVSGATTTVPITLQVRTDDGADEGKAICYFGTSLSEKDLIPMFETNNFEHKQNLDLTNGDYTYYVRCVDAGGNSAVSNTNFKIFVDTNPPKVVRAYKDLDALKIVTDENAQCFYSLNNCNFVFNEGNTLLYSNPDVKNNHYAEWKNNIIYHIKCRDLRGKEPGPNQCSIVVSAVDLV